MSCVALCWKCDTGAPQGTTSFGVKFSRRRLRNGVDGRLSTGHPQAQRRVSRKNGTGVPTAHGRTLWAILPLVAEKGTRNPQPVDYMWKTPTVGGMHEANSGSGGGQGAVPQRPHKTAGPFRQTLREARRVRQAAIAAEAEAERQRAERGLQRRRSRARARREKMRAAARLLAAGATRQAAARGPDFFSSRPPCPPQSQRSSASP